MKSNLSRSDPAQPAGRVPVISGGAGRLRPPETTTDAWLSRAAILDAGGTPAAVRAIRRRGSLTAGTGFQPTYQAPRSPAHLLDGQMLSWLASKPA